MNSGGIALRKVLLVMFAFVAVPASVAVAQSEGLKVTGGGQVIADASNPGPGDTIAFNAQQTGEENADDGGFLAKGQLQVINRTAGTGPSQVKFHGEVTCIVEFTYDNETYIRFGGYEKVRGARTTTPFTVDTQDNGEGNQSDDMILFRQRDENSDPCEEDEPDTDLRDTRLARGNVQAH